MRVRQVYKLALVIALTFFSWQAYAEYYLSYSEYDAAICDNCQKVYHRAKHHPKQKAHASQHYARSAQGIYVYYPPGYNPPCSCSNQWTNQGCDCNPCHAVNRTQWGDYVVFTSRPTHISKAIYRENSPDPDQATTDDRRPDLEIN